MNNELKIILFIILAFALPMTTSLLFELDFITESTPRYILVLLFMITQFLICLLIIKDLTKTQ